MTTFEPGARLVFTQGLVLSPFSTAFLASRPAATITDGFEVLVQLVMAAMTTEPSWMVDFDPLVETSAVLWRGVRASSRKFFFTSGRLMRSCGRLGRPARNHGGEIELERVGILGIGRVGVRNRPCSLA